MEQAYALLNNVKSALKEELNNSVYNNSFADLNKIHKVQMVIFILLFLPN